MPNIRFYDNMLFNYETTNRTSFQPEIITNYPPTVYHDKVSCPRPPYKPLKDIQTLTDFKKTDLHTELFANRNEIVRSNPNKVQCACITSPVSDGHDPVQATRSRLVMPSAVCVDDIKDASVRDLLISNVYKTSANEMQVDVSTEPGYHAPLNGKYSPANPITLQKLQMPIVPAEWRMDSVKWDNRQLRGYCDPNKSFYLSKPLRCEVCLRTSERRAQKKTKFSNKIY